MWVRCSKYSVVVGVVYRYKTMTSYFHNANDAGSEGGVVHGAQHGGVVHEESQHTGHHQLDREHRLVPMVKLHRLQHHHIIVQELCESRGGRPGLYVLTSLLIPVDVKRY